MYLIRQFWRWINEISKLYYEETQKNGNKYVVSENSSLKNFVSFQEKHPVEIAFYLKQSWRLPETYWEFSSGKFSEQLSQKLPFEWWLLQLVVTRKCFDQNIFIKKYLNWFFSFIFWYSMACVPPDMFCKGVLRNFVKFIGKHIFLSLFFNKVAGLKLWDSGQVLSCEFCKISKNNFFPEHLWATASALSL